MRFLLAPVGSSGDVHPFIGVGQRLRDRGHPVVVLAVAPFREAIESAGLEYVQVGSDEDYRRILQDPDLWHHRRGIEAIFRVVCAGMRPAAAVVAAHTTAETVFVGHALAVSIRMAQETLGNPAATLHLAPSVFRSEHQLPVMSPGLDLSWLPRFVKRGLWRGIDRFALDPLICPELNRWRGELGLPPVRRFFHDWIHAPDLLVGLFPSWFAPAQPDWPAQLQLTGFPRFDEAGQHPLDSDLETFLAAGEPPIAFTPGSANLQAAPFFDAALEATRRSGRRALLLTRYPEQLPRELPTAARWVSYAPFSTLLPRCAALVHHGGIGTCAQALAAGIPQLIMPMAFDQPDNAARLARLGVGSWLVPRKFTGERVAASLERLLGDPAIAAACVRTRDRMAAEPDPVDRTCELLEELGRERLR